MRISVISFTEKGTALSQRLAEQLADMECLRYVKCSRQRSGDLEKMPEQKTSWGGEQPFFTEERVETWAKRQMAEGNALLFIGACGIAVRAIAPNLKNKLVDSPVLVMDERGRYVIPILSGHMGGANELAELIGERMGAEPVITTATDINRRFAVDLFAKKNGLSVVNKEGIAKVSGRILAGETILLSVETGHMKGGGTLPVGVALAAYPPAGPVDVVIGAEDRAFDAALILRPREYVIGMGCRKDKEPEEIEGFIAETMEELGIGDTQIAGLATIDAKRGEPGFLAWCRRRRIPFLTYSPGELREVREAVHGSAFVADTVGVDNVCERAALRACGSEGKLICEKRARDGMTIAVARRKWSVSFDES